MFDKLYMAAITGLKLPGVPQTTADQSAVSTLLSIVIGIIAAISLLMIVIGGVRYILSRGDPQAVTRAKNTILYAVIGLVVAITAQAIVSFVLVKVTS